MELLVAELRDEYATQRFIVIDALGFDQFKVHSDPTSCVGVTSGGMPEVVVNGAQLAQTNIVRQP